MLRALSGVSFLAMFTDRWTPALEGVETPSQARQGCRSWGSRHLQIFLMSAGFAITYVMRVNLSVVMVALVNNTIQEEQRRTSRMNATCHLSSSPLNMSFFEPVRKGGLHSFEWSKITQGIVLSSYFWAYWVPLLPAANLLKRFSPKHMFAVGFAAPALIGLFVPLAIHQHIIALIAVRVLQGIFESLVVPSSGTLLARWVPKSERTILFNLCMLGGLVGTIISTVTSGFLATSNLGWESVFYIHSGVSLLWLLPWMIWAKESPAVDPKTSLKEWTHILGREPYDEELMSRNMCEIPRDEMIPPTPWRSMLKDPPVVVFILCQGTRDWLFNTNLACLPQFASDVLQLKESQVGLLTSMLFFVNLVLPLVVAVSSDLLILYKGVPRVILRKSLTGIAFFGTFIALTLVSRVGCTFNGILGLLVFSNIVISFSSGGFIPNPVDLSDVFAGAIFSSANMLSTLACIVSPIAADLLTKDGTLLQWGIVFDIGAAFALVAGSAYVIMGSASHRPWSIKATLAYHDDLRWADESDPLIQEHNEIDHLPNYRTFVELNDDSSGKA